ncbi:MAG TPA: glycosyltransferase family 39 protein [Roseiarcus sp.]|nr:glycosyltransferase family 39 protein [Roseiarcus sp.]
MTAARVAAPALWLAALCLGIHLFANPHHGVFRDELYFIVCGLHPGLGYVDQPPLVPLIAAASYKLFGVALTPLRLFPALAMAATVALVAEFARFLGGGRFAQTLAGLAALASPILLVDGLLMSTDCLQPLTWLACAYLVARLARGGDRRLWLALGAVVGISLWSKYLIAFYVVALLVGIIAAPMRRQLLSVWPWAGALLALAIIAPNLAWQAAHGFPFLEIGAAGAASKNIALSPLGFFGQELLFVGPPLALVWIAGLWRLAKAPQERALAVAYFAAAALFIAGHGKAYYLAPAYPALFAAGGVWWEGVLRPRAARLAALALVVLAGLLTAPLVLPILPPQEVIAYSRRLGLAPGAASTEHLKPAVLPQQFADMFGWREMAAEVARVYRALPEDERRRAVFFGRNYGEAAAVDIYGPALGGPPAISGHNQYFLWGPRGFDGSVVIALGPPGAKFSGAFGGIEVAGHIENAYAMPYESGLDIYVLRQPKWSLSKRWPRLKHYE